MLDRAVPDVVGRVIILGQGRAGRLAGMYNYAAADLAGSRRAFHVRGILRLSHCRLWPRPRRGRGPVTNRSGLERH